MLSELDERTIARRAARELRPGSVVALGPGLPGRVPAALPANAPIQFLSESGVLGYAPPGGGNRPAAAPVLDSDGQPAALTPGAALLSSVDLAAMLRGGYGDTAIVQPFQVNAAGDFVHWTTAAAPGLFPPGQAVDLAVGARRVIAVMPHTGADGSPNLVSNALPLADGRRCVDLVITAAAVIRIDQTGFVLLETAPGWTAETVAARIAAPLTLSPDLREMSLDPPDFSAAALPSSKVYPDGPSALHDLNAGATVMIDGFGGPGGMAHYLLVSLRDKGTGGLTIISNTAGIARSVNFGTPPGRLAIDHSILIDNGQVAKAIATYPVSPSASRPSSFELAYRRGEVELELVPQGTLAERLRAGGAGIAAFYTPTGVGTLIAAGKETRTIDGKEYLLETGLQADFCLIRAYKADTRGNLIYKGTSRNFNAVMAPAARIAIVEVDEIVAPGELDPELIVTPGVYVDRIVRRPADFSAYE